MADANSALRRYLEQRRELGESELVLDTMNVEEALRALGAIKAGALKRADRPRWAMDSMAEPVRPADVRPEDVPSAPRMGDSQASSSVDTPARYSALPADVAPEEIEEDTDEEELDAEAGDAEPSSENPAVRSEPVAEVPPSAPEAPAIRRAPTEESQTMPKAPQGLVVGAAESSMFEKNPFSAVRSIDGIAKLVQECTRCPLYETATNAVPGEGNHKAELMCVGEAPGANEDATGRPFIGAAGQLLTKILGAIDLTREDVFICNVLKHRPPGNRNPKPDEIAACSPYLVRQIELIKPKVIVAFGTFAAQTLLETKTPIGKLRGAIHRYHGVPLIVTYHPAALLRNPAWKRPTWEDVKLARRVLDGTS